MAPDEHPLRCVAVRVTHDATAEIDSLELEVFLNDIPGQDQWIGADQWLFADPPAEVESEATLPVVMPVAAANRAVLNDLTGERPRIVTDYQTSPAEIRRWRWLAFQQSPNSTGKVRFPWEAPFVES